MKTLIWDYNGTIIDDLQLCLDIENFMLEERHMKAGFTKDDYRALFCFPVIDYYYKIGYTFENESYEDVSKEFHDMYAKGFESVTLTEGFEDKIQEAIAKGYRNVILSASRQDNLDYQTAALGIRRYFDKVMGVNDLLASSKIDIALDWMKNSGIDPDECMYIGDSTHDFECAEALGVKNCVLVSCGHQAFDVLKTKTDAVVHTLREIEL